MTILIIHGIFGRAGGNWAQWLHDELIELGHQVIMPTMPSPDKPDRLEWLNEAKELVADTKLGELVIVTHSLGTPTALDFLEQASDKVKGFVSIAGMGEDYGAEMNSYFLREKDVDFKKVRDAVENVFVIYGDDDPYVPQETLQAVADNLQVQAKVIPGGGHLNERAGFTEFPLLLETIISWA